MVRHGGANNCCRSGSREPAPYEFCRNRRKHLAAVGECQSSWPRARWMSIERRILQWRLLKAQWSSASLEDVARDVLTHHILRGEINRSIKENRDVVKECTRLLQENKEYRWRVRAVQLNKRTCSYCGTTGPLSLRALPYCGGCRSVPRVYRRRYCSEVCQHAHWLAGHMHECPCARDG